MCFAGLVEEATVGSKCNSPSRWSTVKASVGGVLRRRLHYLKKQVGITRYPSKAGESQDMNFKITQTMTVKYTKVGR